jgi:flagellar motility protein MotE (MotC chaperone)
MTPKDKLIQELDNVSESLIVEVLDFLYFLQAKQEQDESDIRDARAALATVETEGTVSWDELKAEVGL